MKKRGSSNFLNKKAQINQVYHILFQILIAIIVYWTLQHYIDSVAKDTLFEKSYLSKDLALLTDAIYSGPGEIRYLYTNERAELNKFEFDFNKQKVSVREIGVKEEIPLAFPYGEDLNLQFSGQIISKVNQIAFSKTKNKLEIYPNFKAKVKKLVCPDINTKSDLKQLSILIYSEKTELKENIGKALAEKLKPNFKEVVYLDIEEAKKRSKDFNLIFGIDFNWDDKDRNIITASVFALDSKEAKEKSQKLACKIVNRLIEEDYLITFVKIDISEIMPIREKDKINVMFYLGNLKNANWISVFKDKDKFDSIINSISTTIIKFYQDEK